MCERVWVCVDILLDVVVVTFDFALLISLTLATRKFSHTHTHASTQKATLNTTSHPYTKHKRTLTLQWNLLVNTEPHTYAKHIAHIHCCDPESWQNHSLMEDKVLTQKPNQLTMLFKFVFVFFPFTKINVSLCLWLWLCEWASVYFNFFVSFLLLFNSLLLLSL